MKLQQLNEAKYGFNAGKLRQLLQNFFGEGHESFQGTEYYFKKEFQGDDDGQIETIGIGVGEDEDDLYFLEHHSYQDEGGHERTDATLEQILQMEIYQVRKVNP